MSNDSAALVSRFIFNGFPSNADGFRASLGYRILSQLSHSLARLSYPSGQSPDQLNGRRHDIEIAPALLEDLSTLLGEGFLDDAEVEKKVNRKNTQRGKTLRSKVTSGVHAGINDRLFRALGREAPRSRSAAEELVQSVMDGQRNILEVRLLLSPFHRLSFLRAVFNACLVLYHSHANPRNRSVSSQLIPSRECLARKSLYFRREYKHRPLVDGAIFLFTRRHRRPDSSRSLLRVSGRVRKMAYTLLRVVS